jgi:uncharacterized protein with PQ loop repeat
MLEKIKLTFLTWGLIFMMILLFVSLGLWCIFSIWWILTNNMVDRNMFMILTTSISFILSFLLVLASIFTKEK